MKTVNSISKNTTKSLCLSDTSLYNNLPIISEIKGFRRSSEFLARKFFEQI